MVSLCALCSEKNFHLQQTNMRPFEKRKDFLITIFFDYKKPFPLFRHCESLSSRHCEGAARSNLPIAPPRHCEPKGWQVCWREAISSLLIPFSVKCFEGIASLTTFARNDEKEVFARNDEIGLFARNDVVGLQTCNGVTKTLLIALQRS